jgi:hypothetical protein
MITKIQQRRIRCLVYVTGKVFGDHDLGRGHGPFGASAGDMNVPPLRIWWQRGRIHRNLILFDPLTW